MQDKELYVTIKLLKVRQFFLFNFKWKTMWRSFNALCLLAWIWMRQMKRVALLFMLQLPLGVEE